MENNLPKIYSSKAILGFSVFMSSLFGGILLYINLRNLKKYKEANIVLVISIILTLLTYFVMSIPENPKSSLAYLCGFIGGGILSYFLFPKYIPNEEDFPKKQIRKPLIIAVLIVIVFISLIIFSDEQII
ncbi:rhomboid family intramembrane serine protease [Cloacibacterium sp.]|uniref:rhomboid family intramembrane serine protease n=1 Tax=Cloacibacterium sp. TaxID=1913682 RepID=UPI0039E521EF